MLSWSTPVVTGVSGLAACGLGSDGEWWSLPPEPHEETTLVSLGDSVFVGAARSAGLV